MVEERGERRAVLEFRKHLLAYVRGLPGSVHFKTEAMKLENATPVTDALTEFLASLPDEPIAPPWPANDLPAEGSLTEPHRDSTL
jgi:hypothetical protein